MTSRVGILIQAIEQARAAGHGVAIEWGRDHGYWVFKHDLIQNRDGLLYWEHLGGKTFLLPPEFIFLEFAPTDPTAYL